MAKILLVDDNVELVTIQHLLLSEQGHDVSIATNGCEALRQTRRQHFDVVITDVIMPEKEGLEVIRELRKEQPSTKIIATSGGGRLSAVDCLDIAKKLGAMATLAKPVSERELVSTLDTVLAAE